MELIGLFKFTITLIIKNLQISLFYINDYKVFI